MNATIKIKALDVRIGTTYPVPAYQTKEAAAFDLYACCNGVGETIEPNKRSLIHTGIAVEIPEGYVGLVVIRSSIGTNYGCSLANCVGVIDSDYRGEVMVCVENHSTDSYTVKGGERIAQMMIIPVLQLQPVLVDELSTTARGTGGFGSTGK